MLNSMDNQQEKRTPDQDFVEAAWKLGQGVGLLSRWRKEYPERASDIYQQTLSCIPREEIERFLAARDQHE